MIVQKFEANMQQPTVFLELASKENLLVAYMQLLNETILVEGIDACSTTINITSYHAHVSYTHAMARLVRACNMI